MTDVPIDKEREAAEPATPNQLPIERDANFVRLMADTALVIDRGFGHEISLVVNGPDPDSQFVDDKGASVSVGLKATYTEVGRIRLLAPAAIQMAMAIIEQSLERGRIDIEGFRSAINDMLDRQISSDRENPESSSEG